MQTCQIQTLNAVTPKMRDARDQPGSLAGEETAQTELDEQGNCANAILFPRRVGPFHLRRIYPFFVRGGDS